MALSESGLDVKMKSGGLKHACCSFKRDDTDGLVLVFITFLDESKIAIHASILASGKDDLPIDVGEEIVREALKHSGLENANGLCISTAMTDKKIRPFDANNHLSEELSISMKLFLESVLLDKVPGVTINDLKDAFPNQCDAIEFCEAEFKNGIDIINESSVIH